MTSVNVGNISYPIIGESSNKAIGPLYYHPVHHTIIRNKQDISAVPHPCQRKGRQERKVKNLLSGAQEINWEFLQLVNPQSSGLLVSESSSKLVYAKPTRGTKNLHIQLLQPWV